MSVITVKASRTYTVHIEKGLLARVGSLCHDILPAPRKVMLVSDDTVASLYADAAEQSLQNAGYTVCRFVFPHGEANKNVTTLAALWNALATQKLTRTDFVAALGGGVVGDLTGFAAATYLRGIPFVQIPTTLLAMVDSSVGGKTAVDLEAGKNLAGAFCQPHAVFCDTDLLLTLPDDVFAQGCAEVIKYGYINDPTLLTMLAAPFRHDPEAVIARCVADKRDLVECDEHDTGARQLLNLGHTAGHAIEAASDFSIPHGDAVAIGMLMMSRAAAKNGLCTSDVPLHVEAMLKAHGLPTVCPFTAEQLTDTALSDKKRAGAKLTLVLPEVLGRSRLYPITADYTAVRDFFAAGLERKA